MTLWIRIALVASAMVAAAVVVAYVRAREATPAMRGRLLAERLGCFACHGPGGQGGVYDPGTGALVPGWTWGDAAMYVRDEDDIREWILYGEPVGWEADGGRDGDREPLVPMPAYEAHLTARQLEDLVTLFTAISGWAPEMSDAAYEGWKTSLRLGCFGCHGPSGMGGMSNPGSFKGHIPAWDGNEFGELVRDETELRAWILDGRIERLWSDPVARHFLDGQVIEMPAYRDHISDAELDALTSYVKWLRR